MFRNFRNFRSFTTTNDPFRRDSDRIPSDTLNGSLKDTGGGFRSFGTFGVTSSLSLGTWLDKSQSKSNREVFVGQLVKVENEVSEDDISGVCMLATYLVEKGKKEKQTLTSV